MNHCEHSWTYSSVLLPQRGIAGSYSAWMCVEWELPNLIPECLSRVTFPLAMFLSLLCLLLCRGPQLENLTWVEEDFFPLLSTCTRGWGAQELTHSFVGWLPLALSFPFPVRLTQWHCWSLSDLSLPWIRPGLPTQSSSGPRADLICFSSVRTQSWAGCCPMSENRFLSPPSFLVVHGGRVNLDAVLLPTFVFHLFKIILLHNFK